MRVCPGATCDFYIERKKLLPCWLRISVSEIVNHFFDSHRIFGGQYAVVDEPPNYRVRRSRCSGLEFCVDRARFGGEVSNSSSCLRNLVLTKLVAAEKRKPNDCEHRKHRRDREWSCACPKPWIIANVAQIRRERGFIMEGGALRCRS